LLKLGFVAVKDSKVREIALLVRTSPHEIQTLLQIRAVTPLIALLIADGSIERFPHF
jgi:hypothetical protein